VFESLDINCQFTTYSMTDKYMFMCMQVICIMLVWYSTYIHIRVAHSDGDNNNATTTMTDYDIQEWYDKKRLHFPALRVAISSALEHQQEFIKRMTDAHPMIYPRH